MEAVPALGIGIVGTGFMARVEALAFARSAAIWDLPMTPRVVAFCAHSGLARNELVHPSELRDAEEVDGWESLVRHPDVGLVCVCTKDSAHATISLGALAAGRHVLCEKPLTHRIQDSRRVAHAAERSSMTASVGFNYRRLPAIEHARQLIAAGTIGPPRHVRAAYLQDWGLRRGEAQRGWRFDVEESPNGVLGDVGCHAIDAVQHVVGSPIVSVACLGSGAIRPSGAIVGGRYGAPPLTASILARFADGTGGVVEASRIAAGRRNTFTIEVYGSEGAIAFNLERLNELHLSGGSAPGETFRRILVTDTHHPWMAGRWPPGHLIGWEDTFAHQAHDLVHAIARGVPFAPSFAVGCQVDEVIWSAVRASELGEWVEVDSGS